MNKIYKKFGSISTFKKVQRDWRCGAKYIKSLAPYPLLKKSKGTGVAEQNI